MRKNFSHNNFSTLNWILATFTMPYIYAPSSKFRNKLTVFASKLTRVPHLLCMSKCISTVWAQTSVKNLNRLLNQTWLEDKNIAHNIFKQNIFCANRAGRENLDTLITKQTNLSILELQKNLTTARESSFQQ